MFTDERFEPKVEAPVKLEPWRQALLDGAEYIRQHGWVQGVNYHEGRVCLYGSILKVTGWNEPQISPSFTSPAHKWAYEGASKALENRGYSIGWNDKHGRFKEEVIAALEETARAE